MSAAGIEERRLVGEMAVERGAANSRVLCHGAHRRARWPKRPVQLHRALGDPPAGLLLGLRTALHAVWTRSIGARLTGHGCPLKFDTRGAACIVGATSL